MATARDKQDQTKQTADDAPDQTKSARTATDDAAPQKSTSTKAPKGEDTKDPLQSGALSTAGPDATATVEPGTEPLDGTPTGSPPGEHVFPEHTAEDPEGVLDMVGDGEREQLSPPKGPDKPSKDQLYAEIFTVIRNELAADKPFLRDRIDQLVAKLGGPDRS